MKRSKFHTVDARPRIVQEIGEFNNLIDKTETFAEKEVRRARVKARALKVFWFIAGVLAVCFLALTISKLQIWQ